MKPIIKITDIESGKELEIVKNPGYCEGCFYLEKSGCKHKPNFTCKDSLDIIFKEVTKKVTTKKEKK